MNPPRFNLVQLSRKAWTGVALVVLAPWLAVSILVWRLSHPAESTTSPASAVSVKTRLQPAADASASATSSLGPWGHLEYTRVLIEPPEDFVPDYYTTPQPLRWTFPGYDEARLAALWEKAALPPALRAQFASARCDRTPAGIVLHPATGTVLALTAEARAIIYTALAAFPENAPQHDPFRARADAINAWFDHTRLAPDVIALTRQLLYPRNNIVLFSDADLVLPKIGDAGARADFIKNLSRKSTLLVHLQVRPDSDIEALTRYWGQGWRRKDVRPLLQSLARRPGGGALDIVHLLPAFARSLLYTYPVPSLRAQDAAHDCHWTSFNFFNRSPNDRFIDINVVRETLINDYFPVGGPPQFGDLLVFFEPGGQAVHSCVYIADDIVFTKNGVTFSTPWQFSQLEPLAAFYTLNAPIEVRRYRARER